MTDRIGVLSIDDHAVVHAGLRSAFETCQDIRWLGAISNLCAARAAVTETNPDVVLLDLWIGDEQSWGTARELIQLPQRPMVCIFSAFGNSRLLDRAMREGVHGYILKSTPPEHVVEAVRNVARRQLQWDGDLLKAWTHDYRNASVSSSFSSREIEIIQLIAKGMDNYAIAEHLHLSTHTVKYHIAKALKRTGESNRAALVHRASAEQSF